MQLNAIRAKTRTATAKDVEASGHFPPFFYFEGTAIFLLIFSVLLKHKGYKIVSISLHIHV